MRFTPSGVAAANLFAATRGLLHDRSRHQQRGLQDTVGSINPACFEELERESKTPADVAGCVASCLDDVNLIGAWYHLGQWTPEAVDADETVRPNSGLCMRCARSLRRCPDSTIEYGDEGRLAHGIDLSADTFRCDGTVSWVNQSSQLGPRAPRLFLNDVCFPGVCSYDDIRELFSFEMQPLMPDAYSTTYRLQARADCDILATFFDDSAPWWIMSFGILWAIFNTFCTRAAPGIILRCMVWSYIAWNVVVGGLMFLFGVFFLIPQPIPRFIKFATPLLGIVQVNISQPCKSPAFQLPCVLGLAMLQ
eukprot:SAG31_NODE_5350_length_2593_cov_1.862871_3_plen_307_part_00